jgi:hypothetical protein
MFGFLLVIHILAGTICLITGAVAAWARKRKGMHTIAGEIYHGAYVFIFITSITMAILHWEKSAYLFFIGIFSYGLALFGYLARKLRRRNWIAKHIGGMLGSYIGVITAVLVVNGPKIPVLNEIPPLLLWFLPTIIGTPLIARVGKKYKKAR